MFTLFAKFELEVREVVVYNYFLNKRRDNREINREQVLAFMPSAFSDKNFHAFLNETLVRYYSMLAITGFITQDCEMISPLWIPQYVMYPLPVGEFPIKDSQVLSTELKKNISDRVLRVEDKIITSIYDFFRYFVSSATISFFPLMDRKEVYHSNREDHHILAEKVKSESTYGDTVTCESRYITYTKETKVNDAIQFDKNDAYVDVVYEAYFQGDVKDFKTTTYVQCQCYYRTVQVWYGYSTHIPSTLVFDKLIIDDEVPMVASYSYYPSSALADKFHDITEEVIDIVQAVASDCQVITEGHKVLVNATFNTGLEEEREQYLFHLSRGYISIVNNSPGFMHVREVQKHGDIVYCNPYTADRDTEIHEVLNYFFASCHSDIRDYYFSNFIDPDDAGIADWLHGISDDDSSSDGYYFHSVTTPLINFNNISETLYDHFKSLDEDAFLDEVLNPLSDLKLLVKTWRVAYDSLEFCEQKNLPVSVYDDVD